MSEQFQLERWTGSEYVPHGKPQTPAPGAARRIGDTARTLGLPAWRVVRVDKDRPRSRPRAWRPTPSHATGRSAADVRGEYLAWAAARGLECVTVYYEERPVFAQQVAARGFTVREVDPADFLGPAPDPETIEEC